ncbi:MAG: cupin [Candidatus Binatia bacterium]
MESAVVVAAAGNTPKTIKEFFGRVRSEQSSIGIAHMRSPAGWTELGQTPDFDEFSVVIRGMLRVESHAGTVDVRAGQAVHAPTGDWVRNSTPEAAGAEY